MDDSSEQTSSLAKALQAAKLRKTKQNTNDGDLQRDSVSSSNSGDSYNQTVQDNVKPQSIKQIGPPRPPAPPMAPPMPPPIMKAVVPPAPSPPTLAPPRPAPPPVAAPVPVMAPPPNMKPVPPPVAAPAMPPPRPAAAPPPPPTMKPLSTEQTPTIQNTPLMTPSTPKAFAAPNVSSPAMPRSQAPAAPSSVDSPVSAAFSNLIGQQADQLDDLFAFLGEVTTNPAPEKVQNQESNVIAGSELDDDFQKELRSMRYAVPEPKVESKAPVIQASASPTIKKAQKVVPPEEASPAYDTRNATLQRKQFKAEPRAEITSSNDNLVAADFRYTDYPIHIFAEKVLNIPNNAGYDVKKKLAVISEILEFQKQPITAPLCKYQSDRFDSELVESFKLIQKLMDPSKKVEDSAILLQQLIQLGLKREIARDEILLQILKQCTPSTSAPKNHQEMVLMGIMALCEICGTFPPSKEFKNYVLAFLIKVGGSQGQDATSSSISRYCDIAESNVMTTSAFGARKYAPSNNELVNFLKRKDMIMKVKTMDFDSKSLLWSSSSTATSVVNDMARILQLQLPASGWALYTVEDNQLTYIPLQSYIGDIFIAREREVEFFFYKRVLTNINQSPDDAIEYHLLYCQASYQILNDFYPVTEKVAIYLAALKAQITWGDCDPLQKSRFERLAEYIPASMISKQSKDSWIKGINDQQQSLFGKSAVQAKVLYLERVRQFELYGSAIYVVKHEGFWSYPEVVALAISARYFSIANSKTKEILISYLPQQVAYWKQTDDKLVIVLRTDPNASIDDPKAQTEAYKFATPQGYDILDLLQTYFAEYRSSAFKTGEEGQKILSVDAAREQLLVSRTLNLPGPFTMHYLDGKLQNLTKKIQNLDYAIEIVKNTDSADLKIHCEAYPDLEWNFVKPKIYQSLLNVEDDPKFSEQSVNTWTGFHIIAESLDMKAYPYAKDISFHPYPSFALTQLIIFSVLDDDYLRDECFLQLIWLTNIDMEPNENKEVAAFWKLMLVFCSICKPYKHEVEAYLRAHLQDIEKRKVDISKIAAAAYKSLSAVQDRPRQFPPSIMEILAIHNFSDMAMRIQTVDGQTKANAARSFTKVGDLLNAVCERSKITNPKIYALFESKSADEMKKLQNKFYIGDVYFQLEVLAIQSLLDQGAKKIDYATLQEALKSMKIVFAKNLSFPELEDQEANLLGDFQEASTNVISEYHPLSREEAIELGALTAQIQVGDQNFRKMPTYDNHVMTHLPPIALKLYRDLVKSVEAAHAQLKGKSSTECMQQYLSVIKNWEFSGSRFFLVQQNIEHSIPVNVVLAVNAIGIQMFSQYQKNPRTSIFYGDLVAVTPYSDRVEVYQQGNPQQFSLGTRQAVQIATLIGDYLNFAE